MSMDERIRAAFARHAADTDGRTGSWPAIEHGIRRRARRTALAVPAVMVVLVLIGIAAQALLLEPQPDGFIGPRPDGATAAPEGTSPPEEREAPASFLVLTGGRAGERRIEQRSTRDGSIERTIRIGGLRTGSLSASLATRRAYVLDRAHDDCSGEILAVDLTSGEAEMVARGGAPAISPDGRWLAYAAYAGACDPRGLIVRDLHTNAERTWAPASWGQGYGSPGEGPLRIATISWGPDSRHLVFTVLTGDPGVAVFALDRTEGDDLLDATRLDPPMTNDPLWHLRLLDARTAVGVTNVGDLREREDVVRLSAGTSTRLGSFAAQPMGFDVTATGERWLYSRAEYNGEPGGVVMRHVDTTVFDRKVDLDTGLTDEVAGEVVWLD